MSGKAAGGYFVVLFQCQNKTWDTNGDSTDQRQLDRNEWVFAAQTGKEQTQQHGVQCLCKIQGTDPFDVGNDGAAFFHNVFHGRKFGVHQYNVGGLTGGICSFCHGDTAVGIFESQNIIDTVPYHTYNVIVFLERLYNGVLFFW